MIISRFERRATVLIPTAFIDLAGAADYRPAPAAPRFIYRVALILWNQCFILYE